METYAYFRLPEEEKATLISQNSGSSTVINSFSELDGKSGFLFSPFSPSTKEPTILIRPDVCRTVTINKEASLPERFKVSSISTEENDINLYTSDFNRFHHKLVARELDKVVLARVHTLISSSSVSPFTLFSKACTLYPHLFVALISTPITGTWIIATPELLMASDNERCSTMALAGTMKAKEYKDMTSWGEKERQEQSFVSSYIHSVLEPISSDIKENGPRTITAADLVHLRTEFTFKLKERKKNFDALEALHPTPAVCGLPKKNALSYILKNEHSPRKYYSGFAGPWSIKSKSSLFVSLRCMHINNRILELYAGGGLLKESKLLKEWEETEAKLNTMRRLLNV